VGKPCAGTRVGLGALQEGPSFAGKSCVISGPDTVRCPMSTGGLGLVFQLDNSASAKSCLGFRNP